MRNKARKLPGYKKGRYTGIFRGKIADRQHQVDRIKKLTIDIKREISFIINTRIKDPRIGFITVTDARLSVDGKYLDIYFSTMGKEAAADSSKKALERCSGFIKRNLSKRIRLRIVPELKFIYDDSIDRGIKITEILNNISIDGKSQD